MWKKVISLNPDVIFMPLYFKDQYEADYKPKIDAAGIPTIYIDYHAEKLEKSSKNLSKLSVKHWVKKSVQQKSTSSILTV